MCNTVPVEGSVSKNGSCVSHYVALQYRYAFTPRADDLPARNGTAGRLASGQDPRRHPGHRAGAPRGAGLAASERGPDYVEPSEWPQPPPQEQVAMIAAIYARKSTEQNGVADQEKSVTRQVDHATQYAVGKGWTVSGRPHLPGRRGERGGVQEPTRLRAADERLDADTALPGPDHERGIPPGPRGHRDRLRAEAVGDGGRAGLLLPGGPGAVAGRPDGQGGAVAHDVRRRTGAGGRPGSGPTTQ